MKTLITTVTTLFLAGIVLVPQQSSAMVIDGNFPFFHPLADSQKSQDVNAKTAEESEQNIAPEDQPAEEREEKNEPAPEPVNEDSESQAPDAADSTVDAKDPEAGADEDSIEQIAGRLQALLDAELAKVVDLRTKIEADTAMAAELRASILADLDADTTFFNEQQVALTAAASVAELHTVAESIKSYLATRGERLYMHESSLKTQAEDAAKKAQLISETIITKLHTVSTALQGHGVDTAELDAQIDTFTAHVEALAQVDETVDADTLRGAIQTIRTELETLMATIQSLVQGS